MEPHPVVKQFLIWAEGQVNIRTVLLVGSRAIPAAPVDAWSDYDLALFVGNPEVLAASNDWLNRFGDIMIQLPEKVDFEGKFYPSRLVIYQDGPKIDFAVYGVEVLKAILAGETLPVWMQPAYQVLLDKDNLVEQLPEISGIRSFQTPPTESEYLAAVNEFFWELIYLLKNLQREDLWLARYNESVLREQLLRMLEWLEWSRHGWSYSTGYLGRDMKNWLDPKLYKLVKKTFAGAEILEDHSAIEYMLRLVRISAEEIADDLGYTYPEQLDLKVMAYITKCWRENENI